MRSERHICAAPYYIKSIAVIENVKEYHLMILGLNMTLISSMTFRFSDSSRNVLRLIRRNQSLQLIIIRNRYLALRKNVMYNLCGG